MKRVMQRHRSVLLFCVAAEEAHTVSYVLKIRTGTPSNRLTVAVHTATTLDALNALLSTPKAPDVVVLYRTLMGHETGGDEAAYRAIADAQLTHVTILVPNGLSDFEHQGAIVGYGSALTETVRFMCVKKTGPKPRKQEAA